MRTLANFAADKNGNISIMFVFMLALVMLFTGGAVDFSRRNAVRADLIESLDAAGLAMAQLDEANPPELAAMSTAERTEYLKVYGEKFFHENFAHEDQLVDFSLEFDVTEQKIEPIAHGKIKTLFLGVASQLMGDGGAFDSLSMEATTEITRRGSGPIEIALVLDITGSMDEAIDGTKKIDSLKTASNALLNVLYGADDGATSEFVKTAVVPFAAHVNAGAALDDEGNSEWDAAWSDTSAAATYHGARFLHVTSAGAIDFNTKVNHFNLFNSIAGTSWAGCFEERPYPLDEIDTAAGLATTDSVVNGYKTAPAGTTNALVLGAFSGAPSLSLATSTIASSANSRFTPMFAPEDPDCGSTACNYTKNTPSTSGSYTLYTSGGGVKYYGHFFKDPDDDGGSISESAYDNSYISDYRYTRSTGTNLDKYVKVVEYARRVWRNFTGESSGTGKTQCYTNPSALADTKLQAWLTARGATECGAGDEYILRQGYVGWFDSTTSKYVGKLNLTNSISSSKGPNDGCPSAAILTQTQNKDDVKDFIDNLSPGGQTNSATGLMWGWRVLSPEAPFESDVPYNDDKWQKAVVLMTDGFNTISSRNTHLKSQMSAYGYALEERMGLGIDTASEMRDEFDQKLLRICARMKEKNILIYAITFGLSDSDPDELATKKIFQACASDEEAPYYFDAPSGEDLEDAFTDIASDLVQLHVSK